MTPTIYKPRPTGLITGLDVPYNQGYDTTVWGNNAPTADQGGSSGYFTATWSEGRAKPTQYLINMWITDLTADFTLSGTTGQSRMQREFFPRSFNDVTLTITGNCANSQEYNRLALFVRESQWRALSALNSGSATVHPMVNFVLNSNAPITGRSVKGQHRPWSVSGYIQNMAAGAVALDIAPEFTIQFIVATSSMHGNTGLWQDSLAKVKPLANMLTLLGAQPGHTAGSGYVRDPITPAPSHKDRTASVGKSAGTTPTTPLSDPLPWTALPKTSFDSAFQ